MKNRPASHSANCQSTFLTEQITVRELMRSRVYQEVKDHNDRHALRHQRTPSLMTHCSRGEVTP